MKIIIQPSTCKKCPIYPYIGQFNKNSSILVLFVGFNEGIALQHETKDLCTRISKTWAENEFIPFEGDLCIEA